MHETFEAIQVALTVWTTVGAGGYLLRRRGQGTKSSRAANAPLLSNGGPRLPETISDSEYTDLIAGAMASAETSARTQARTRSPEDR